MRRSRFIRSQATKQPAKAGEGADEQLASDMQTLKMRTENMERALGDLANQFVSFQSKIDKLLSDGPPRRRRQRSHSATGEDSAISGYMSRKINDAAVSIQTHARGMFGRKR